MKKRMISLLLCLCMVFSLLPTVVLAGGAEPTAPTDITMQYDDYANYGANVTVPSDAAAVLEVVDGKLHAKGVGSATFTANGTEYSVTVEKAKLNIVLVAGQSNANGVHGNLDVPAITPAKGNSYWWTGSALTDLSEEVEKQEQSEKNKSVGWYPALAAEWYALTGEKTVIIHDCYSGSSIKNWVAYDGTVQERTNHTAEKVRDCIKAIDKNKFEIKHAGYYWLQGETDAFLTNSEGIKDYTTADKYEKAYLAMHREFIKALDTAGVGSYGAILSCRTRNDIGNYQALEYCGMRVAQQDLANQNANIYMATVLTDEWHKMGDVSFTAKSNEFGTLTYTTAAMGANNIHYNQSGYNVLGLDAADNMHAALFDKPSITGIELIGHNGYTKYQDDDTIKVEDNRRIIGENNVEEDTGKAQIVARTLPISAASSGVTMTLTDASNNVVTGVMDERGWIDTTRMPSEDLTLTVKAGDITKTYKLSKASGGTTPDPEEPADSFYYNWDFTDDAQYGKNAEGMVTLASKADENTLTYTQKTATHNAAAGLSNNSGQYFSMEKAVTLSDKAKWTIEWRGVQKTDSNGLLLSNNDSDWTGGNTRTTPYLYLRNGGDGGAYDVSYCYEGTFGAEGNKLFNLKGTEHENDLSSAAWSLSCDGNGNLTLTNDKNYSATVKINSPVTYNGVLGRFGSSSPLCYFGTIECLKIYSADRAADSFYYNWDFTDNEQYNANTDGKVTLASKADKNTLTYTEDTATHDAAAGLSNNDGKYFSMEKAVTLSDTAKWTIEWRGVQKTGSNSLLLSNNDSDYNSTDGRTTPYLYLRNGGDGGAYDVSYCYKGTVDAAGNQKFKLKGTAFEKNLATAAWSLSCDGNKTLTLTNDKGYSQTVTIDGPVTYNGVLGRFGSSLSLCYSGTIEYLKIYSADRAAEAATQHDYYWNFTKAENGTLEAETSERWSKNTLRFNGTMGEVTEDGLKNSISNGYFDMETAVVLPQDEPWTIEWKGRTTAQSVLLANNKETTDQSTPRKGGEYIYIFNDHRLDNPNDNGISLRINNTNPAATFNGIPTEIRESTNTVWYLIHDGNGNLKLAANVDDRTFVMEAANKITQDYTFNGVLGYFTQDAPFDFDGTIQYLKIYHSAKNITAPADAELTMDTSAVPRTGYQAGRPLDLKKLLVVKYGNEVLTNYSLTCTPAVLGEGENIVNVEVRYMGKSVTEQLTVFTPHKIYAFARLNSAFAPLTSVESGEFVELNEATLTRLGLGSYNDNNYISIGTFDFDKMPLTDDQYFGNVAELNAAVAELAESIALENGVSEDTAEKIAWTVLYKTVSEEDMVPGYPAEDGYQLSGNLDLATVMFKAGGENVTGMPEDNYLYDDVVGLYDFYFAGDTFTLPTTEPTREGYSFEGWSVKVIPAENDAVCCDADGADNAANETLLKAGDTYTITGSGVVFTAQWKLNTYTVTFDPNADDATVSPTSKKVTFDAPYGDLPTPTRAHHTFNGWYLGTDKVTEATIVKTAENHTLRAAWSRSYHALTINYVDKNGNPVADSYEASVALGADFSVTSPDVKGYKLRDKDDAVIEGTMTAAGYTYDVVYVKKSSGGSGVQIESPNKPKQDSSLKFNTAEHFAYINGYPDGTVKPTGDVTRAEVAAILYRVMDADCVKTYETTRCSFSDVVRGDWFNLYVATLENAGVIVDTRTNGKFRPNEAITRAELAAMLAQFADIKSAANSFNDVSARHWASDEIAVCAKMGWINGYPDGSFRPDATITRAEMMAMINRALGRTPKSADDLLSGMKTWRDNANVNAWYYLDVQEATNSHTYTKSGTHETWKKLR